MSLPRLSSDSIKARGRFKVLLTWPGNCARRALLNAGPSAESGREIQGSDSTVFCGVEIAAGSEILGLGFGSGTDSPANSSLFWTRGGKIGLPERADPVSVTADESTRFAGF